MCIYIIYFVKPQQFPIISLCFFFFFFLVSASPRFGFSSISFLALCMQRRLLIYIRTNAYLGYVQK